MAPSQMLPTGWVMVQQEGRGQAMFAESAVEIVVCSSLLSITNMGRSMYDAKASSKCLAPDESHL